MLISLVQINQKKGDITSLRPEFCLSHCSTKKIQVTDDKKKLESSLIVNTTKLSGQVCIHQKTRVTRVSVKI